MNCNNLRLFLAGLLLVLLSAACEEDLPVLDDNDPRTGIEGNWNVNEDSELFKKSTAGFYIVNISKHRSDSSKVLISNFYELPGSLSVTMEGRKLSIPKQTISGYTIQGYGLISYSFGKIEWSYTVDLNTGEKDNVTAVYSR